MARPTHLFRADRARKRRGRSPESVGSDIAVAQRRSIPPPSHGQDNRARNFTRLFPKRTISFDPPWPTAGYHHHHRPFWVWEKLCHSRSRRQRFFCVDNIPALLIPKFIDLAQGYQEEIRRIALGRRSARRPILAQALPQVLSDVRGPRAITLQILFFDASDEVLLRRFSETRRPHPLAGQDSIQERHFP